MAHAPIGKPQITYKAYYNDNPLAESLIKTYSSKEKIPSSIKFPGGYRLPLVGIVETITTVLYDAPIEGPRKEESNSAEKNSPDRPV